MGRYHNQNSKFRPKPQTSNRLPKCHPQKMKTPKTRSIPLRIASMNVNGLSTQSALGIEEIVHQKRLDIVGLSKTHHRADLPRERYPIDGFTSWHCDREGRDKWGGGLTIYYTSTTSQSQSIYPSST